MKKMRYSKASLLTVSIIALTLLLTPSVFASFELIIWPDTGGPIRPGTEKRELDGFAEAKMTNPLLSGSLGPWFWSSYTIAVADKPEWAVIAITPSDSMLKPGTRQNISVVISVLEDAPAYEYGVINLDIEAGFFCRNSGLGSFIFPSYPMDQPIMIQAGYLPLLTPTPPIPQEGTPNSQITHMITLKNSGNARSKLDFTVNVPESDLDQGWNAQPPTTVFLDVGETIEVPLAILTPSEFGFVDDWAFVTLDVKTSSPLELTSNNTATYTITTTSHCRGYFVPGVPGGDNPGVVFGSLAGIIIVIIIVLFMIVRFIKNSSLKGKISLKRNKDKKE